MNGFLACTTAAIDRVDRGTEPRKPISLRGITQALSLLTAAPVLLPLQAPAQDYPAKPVRIIPVGGGEPLVRLLGQKFVESWNHQVVVDDRPGAAGMIAGQHVARAAPDGYTLLMATSTFVITPNFYKMPFDILKDFTHISIVAQVPFMMVAHPGLPVRSLAELVKLAKARPGEITFSAASPGSPAALVGELFKHTAGVNLLHVPYKALPGALMDVVAGQIHLGFTVPPLAIPQLQAKRLRHLAIATQERSAVLPEIPTFGELGYGAVVATGWYGMLAPAGTPGHVVARVHAEVTRALKLPDVRTRVLGLGMDPVGSSPAETTEFIRAEQAKWARFVKAANIKIDTSAGP